MCRKLNSSKSYLLRTAQREQFRAEPAGPVIRIRVNALVHDGCIVASAHDRRQEAGVVAAPEQQQLATGDHRQTNRLFLTLRR